MRQPDVQLADLIQGLASSAEFARLQELGTSISNDARKFDLLSLFDDVLVENSWSRLFVHLLSSQSTHALRQAFFRKWLEQQSRSNSVIGEFLLSLPSEEESETIAVSEWVTRDHRRLDILVRVIDRRGATCAVVGIENKVESGEQADQLADYQRALILSFPNIPKIIFFLTPDGRPSLTAVERAECP